MIEITKRTECGWAGPPPEVGSPRPCEACGLLRTFGDVKHKRCLHRGQSVQSDAAQPEPPRYDWFADVPCEYRGKVTKRIGCGCAESGTVILRQCMHFGGDCTATDADRTKLLKKHRDAHDTSRSCESCPIREMETQTAAGEALDSPSSR